jgi:hypothetical protein
MNVISSIDVTQMQRNLSASCRNLKEQLSVAFHLFSSILVSNSVSSECGFCGKMAGMTGKTTLLHFLYCIVLLLILLLTKSSLFLFSLNCPPTLNLLMQLPHLCQILNVSQLIGSL